LLLTQLGHSGYNGDIPGRDNLKRDAWRVTCDEMDMGKERAYGARWQRQLRPPVPPRGKG